MTRSENSEETLRLAVIALMGTLIFGILDYYKDKTFESAGIDFFLRFSAGMLFYIVVPVFALYLIVSGLNLRYTKKESLDRHRLFYMMLQ